MTVSRSVVTASCWTSPISSSRWFSPIERACAVSSAASTSRSRSGSVATDSTGRPSRATSESASTPPMRSLIRLSCSRNMSGSRLEKAQVAPQEVALAGRAARLLAALEARQQARRVERPPAFRELRQRLGGGGVVRFAVHHLAEDALGLRQVPLAQVEEAERGGGRLAGRSGFLAARGYGLRGQLRRKRRHRGGLGRRGERFGGLRRLGLGGRECRRR